MLLDTLGQKIKTKNAVIHNERYNLLLSIIIFFRISLFHLSLTLNIVDVKVILSIINIGHTFHFCKI